MEVLDIQGEQWQWEVKNTFIEVTEPPPKLRRTSSDPSVHESRFHYEMDEAMASAHTLFKNLMQSKTHATLDFPATDKLLLEGSVLFMARPPHKIGSLDDTDVEILGNADCFEKRLADMEAMNPPAACRPIRMEKETKKKLNDRQKERADIQDEKNADSQMLCNAFHVFHVSAAQLLPEARALRGWLRDLLRNKVPGLMTAKMQKNERSALAFCAAAHVFFEVGLFLTKFHNHPEGDLAGLKEQVARDPHHYAQVALDWAGADKITPALQDYISEGADLGLSFNGTIAGLVDQALLWPERRLYLRRSRHIVPCWRIKIPKSIEGMYLGDGKTVTNLLKQAAPEAEKVDQGKCMDVQRMHKFTILLLQHPDNNWDCSPGPVTQFPPGGWVYTMCKLCNGSTQGASDGVNCQCTRWLRTCLPEAMEPLPMERTKLPMDEFLVPSHCSGFLLGPPADQNSLGEGALSIRQFTLGKVNIVALGFVTQAAKK